MKKALNVLVALLVCGALNVQAAQDTDILPTEVRNPKLLETWLEANATDAESRLVSNATNSNQLILTTRDDAGTAWVSLQADAPSGVADDAGDKFAILATDGSGLAIQSDAAVKGTLATKVTISGAGGIAAADAITLTDADGASAISSIGYEGSAATLILDADQGDDNADTVTFSVADGGVLSILNHTTEIATLSAAGALAVDAGVAAGDAVTLTDANGNATVSAIAASGAYHAELVLDSDAGEDNADTWTIRAQDDNSNALSVQNHTTEVLTLSTAGALAVDAGVAAGDAVTLTDADGAAAISAIAASGAYDATLTLDADAGEDNGDTWVIESEAADNDLSFVNHTTERFNITAAGAVSVPGTLGVTGVGTFTAESVHNGGIDADYITTDAGAGIDAKTSGALKIGVSTATTIDIGSNSVSTVTIGGTTVAITNNATVAGTLGATGKVTTGAAIELGNASDTTLARQGAANVTLEGQSLVVGPSTSKYMIQTGSATSGQAIVFSPVYTTVPNIVCSAVGASTHVFRATVADTTNATINANTAGSDLCNWISVGVK